MSDWARSAFLPALKRLDLLLHREIVRLRARYQLSLDEFRGLYISDQQVDALLNASAGATGADPEQLSQLAAGLRGPALSALAQDTQWQGLCLAYELSPMEQELLLLTLAPELDIKYETLFAYLNNDITRKYPTVELAMRLFSEQAAAVRQGLSDTGKLLARGLLQEHSVAQPIYQLHTGFLLSPVVAAHLLGCAPLTKRLRGCASVKHERPRPWSELPFPVSVLTELDQLTRRMAEQRAMPTVVLEAGKHGGAELLARTLLSACGYAVLEINASSLANYPPDDQAVITHQLTQVAKLRQAGILLKNLSAVIESSKSSTSLAHVLQSLLQCGQPLVVPVEQEVPWRMWLQKGHLWTLQLPAPNSDQRERMWRYCLHNVGLQGRDTDLALLADFFHLDYAQVESAVEVLSYRHRPDAVPEQVIEQSVLFNAAKEQSRGEIGNLAQRVENRFTMADLVLPAAISSRIREVIAAVRLRRVVYDDWDMRRRVGAAKGLAALFAGASGTGKTMTASVIADELGLDLYRVELSGVVSKYIGETEKNLDKIFASARQANCILFFDEADALFGKRSEVKDAHDRYANIEVAYLLQKMENHDGFVILTTNLLKSIDQAFSRRMQFIVEFPRPDAEHREALWRGMFGPQAPLASDVDFNFLARQFDNTGGDIKNIALDAALLAASTNQPIDMALLVRASARQLRKQGKVPSANEFKHYFNLVNTATH